MKEVEKSFEQVEMEFHSPGQTHERPQEEDPPKGYWQTREYVFASHGVCGIAGGSQRGHSIYPFPSGFQGWPTR